MKVLVINSGSSSLKFKLFNVAGLVMLAAGIIERIGEETGHARLKYMDAEGGSKEIVRSDTVPSHQEAVQLMSELLRKTGHTVDELSGIGHRVVHGGEMFKEPVLIDRAVIATIEDLSSLAPLHNPANLTGIRTVMNHVPDIPQVAVFDTAFHQTIPEHAFLYALPHRLYKDYRVRRYGFHGTSHAYVSREAAKYLSIPCDKAKLITLHLGNGASAAAIDCGRSIDTSMGLTPLEGLIMGTRCGDIDPAILFYLVREAGMELDGLDRLLNRESGLRGICGENDMRAITKKAKAGDSRAELALKMFCYRIRKYTGAYLAALGGADCIVFTGGIGENSAQVRQMACEGLENMGICIDDERNSSETHGIVRISTDESPTAVLVVPTDEELEIACRTLRVIKNFAE